MQNDMRDRLIEDCENVLLTCDAIYCKDCEHKNINFPHCMSVHIADHLIANDVVSVVRCKDCKYCEKMFPRKKIGEEAEKVYFCHSMNDYVNSADYCNYGERKDDK